MFSIYNNGKPSLMGYSQTRENGLKISNFALFSSAADAVELCLFRDGKESRFAMSRTDDIWHVAIEGVELNDEYAFRITGKNDRTLANPQKLMLDPYAKAVTHKPDLSSSDARSIFLLNDERDNAAVAPKGRIVDEHFDWSGDCKPSIPWAQTIVYELNVKGFSQLNSRIPENIRGTYAALAHPENIAYFKSLGITSLELLPVNFFIDEPHLQEKGLRNYWGYNPLAMFALEPSYATDQKQPLNEFKSMVKALHQAGIEVILDVVFNHTAESEKSFPTFCQRGIDDKTYYWQNEHGDYLNWTGCGNMLNLANDVTRKWVLDCLRYWVTECHVDGFRFDLMGIHDVETMNEVKAELAKLDPSIFVYGEGWTASDSPLPEDQRAIKVNAPKLNDVAVFSDDLRDALKGSVFETTQAGFASGKPEGNEESIKFGIVGAIRHPQIDYNQILYCKAPYANKPTQVINYVSCHDDLCLMDKLKLSAPKDATPDELIRFGKLAQTIIFTSQGVPFMRAGEELLHDKKGVHNSYQSPDSINEIDWSLKAKNKDVFNYYKDLIALRKSHPAFRIATAEGVREALQFQEVNQPGVVAYTLGEHANGDSWKKIMVIFNGNRKAVTVSLPEGTWIPVCKDGRIYLDGKGSVQGKTTVSASSALILKQD